MSIRAVVIGIILALFVSSFTYFNDAVIRHPFFIGNHLPISVFGFAMLLLLVFNPLLRKHPLRKSEVAIVIVLGLAVCGWPGSSFYRVATPAISVPQHMEKTHTGWQSQHVMSYVPGGSPLLGQGQVSDWGELAEKIETPNKNEVAQRIRHILDDAQLQVFEEAAGEEQPLPAQIDRMTRALNQVIKSPDFYRREAFTGIELSETARSMLERGITQLSSFEVKRLNRALLVSAFRPFVLPRPVGDGVMLSMGEDGQRVLDAFIMGRPQDDRWSLTEIPWHVWWPNIVLWGGLALLMGLGTLCLALVVHQQWSQHELLSYPIPRFIDEVTERESGKLLPTVVRNKLFWTSFAVVFGIRLLNGSAAWFEGVPELPLRYDLTPLLELFPDLRRVSWSNHIFQIQLFPAVIGFCFFLRNRASFSIGIANILWLFFGAFFVSRGMSMGSGSGLLRFGAYLGFAVMLCYTGRYYYTKIAASAVGFRRPEAIPRYAVWAGRGLAVSIILSVLLLTSVGVPAFWAASCVLILMIMFLVISRIVSETGMFFVQAKFLPIGVLTSLFGVEAIGPVPYIVMALLSIMFAGDLRTTLMPYLNNALKIGEKSGRTRPSRQAPWLVGILIVGFIVAGIATMFLQHNLGGYHRGRWAAQSLPATPFNKLSSHLSDMSATGMLSEINTQAPWERLSNFSPEQGAYGWLLLGFGLVLITAFAYLRLSRWPLHPVAFLVWGTWAMGQIANSFLIGWAVKATVVKVGGANGYHKIKPVMVGLIAGDLLGGILWITIAVIYYFATGSTPETYIVFPT